MNPRKSPRVAIWLLNRFGLARQIPPLVGDLLEEFGAGRTTGWFWRQTLVVILTGVACNARRFRRLLVARLIGWAAAAGVAFGLWACHLPLRLDGLFALLPAVALMLLWFVLAMRQQSRQRQSLEDWSDLDEHEWRFSQRLLLGLFAGTWFIACLMIYGIAVFLVALSHSMPLSFVIFFQVQLLIGSVTDVLAPMKEPGRAVSLLTREKP